MRTKLIIGHALIVLMVGLVSFLGVRSWLNQALVKRAALGVERDIALVAQSVRSLANELTEYTSTRAQSVDARVAFLSGVGERDRRLRAFEVVQAISTWFADPQRGHGVKPDLVVIVDETGAVIARDTDVNRMFGEQLISSLAGLRQVLRSGVASHSMWSRDGKLLQTAMAPIRVESGAVVGALVVAYDLSMGVASEQAKRVGRDVAFVFDENVYSASTPEAERRDLEAMLFAKERAQVTNDAVQQGQAVRWSAELGGDAYIGASAGLGVPGLKPTGVVVLESLNDARAPSAISWLVVLMALIGAGAAVVYSAFVTSELMSTIQSMEEAVFSVVNGATSARVGVTAPEFGGLAYRINQLINHATGSLEADAEGRAVTGPNSIPWRPIDDDDADPASAALLGGGDSMQWRTDPSAGRVFATPDAAYLDGLYETYVTAKQVVGEDVSNITREKFMHRVSRNAEHLASKHNVARVRFRVETRDSSVNLVPVFGDGSR